MNAFWGQGITALALAAAIAIGIPGCTPTRFPGGVAEAGTANEGGTSGAGQSGSGPAAGTGIGGASATAGAAPLHTLLGGDVTYRNLLSDLGAEFVDARGQRRDVLDILRDSGFELARIRIYNAPGTLTDVHGSRYQLQPGYQDLADALRTGKAAAERQLELFVSLHYSDFWTNPAQQSIPAAWAELSFPELLDATYAFTRDVMIAFQNAGIEPKYIALGNEINTSLMGHASSRDEYFQLLRRGAAAVRDVSSRTKIVIHLTDPLQRSFYETWFSRVEAAQLDYDVLGLSLYPFWTGWSIEEMASFASWASSQSGKRVLICEMGALFTGGPPGEYPAMGDERFPVTPEGQHDYLAKYFKAMRRAGVVEGISYWDPIWIQYAGAGWVVGQGNTEWDSALFDSTGSELPALKAFAF